MIVHSDAIGSMVFFLVMLVSALMLMAALMCLPGREFRLAGKIVGWWGAGAAAYTALTIVVSLLLPQKIVNPGQSYCVDIWCISVQNVTKTLAGQDVAYKDRRPHLQRCGQRKDQRQGGVAVSGGRARQALSVGPRSFVIPFDTELSPKQSVDTTLTFRGRG